MNAFIDLSEVRLKTPRLLLRPFELSDEKDFFEYASVEGVGEAAGWRRHACIEETRFVLYKFIEEKRNLAIVYKRKVIGSIGAETYAERLYPSLAEKRGAEIGFALSRSFWNKGFATEALTVFSSFLFSRKSLDFLLCGYFEDNPASKRVQEKCGFEFFALTERKDAADNEKKAVMNIKMNDFKLRR